MPGPIVHLIVEQQLPRHLVRFKNQGKPFADLLNADTCSPYTGFGSMGPDFLFFSLKEYGTPLDDIVNFIFGVYDALEPLIEFYEENIEPVVDDIEDAIAALDDALFQGLFQQIKATADAASTTALTAVAAVVTGQIDLFYPFYPKLQQGAPEKDWYWFDFLHYRRTGRFASEMWSLAGSDQDLQRYVLGYVSHIATDVVGHPFVNAITGGPYRTHWHRHKLVENWIDAYARNAYPDSVQTKTCLGLTSDDTYLPTAISGSYYYRLTEFPEGKLPPKLAEMFVQALDNTYGDIDHPTSMSPTDVDTTYRLWLMWFERTTSIGDAVKPTPVPPPGGAAITLITDFFSGFPSFPGPPGPGGGGFSVLDIFAAIFSFVKWLVDTLTYVVDWIITHAVDIVTLPYVEAIALVKWLLYQIQKAIYEIYDNLRFMLVLGAYIFPEPRDLVKWPWNPALLNSAFAHLTGGPFASFPQYPRKQEAHGLVGTTEHHLVYPGTLQEQPAAEPAPIPFHGVFPPAFISQNHPYNPVIESLYTCDKPYGPDASATHFVDSTTWSTAQFGSAMTFSARLIAQQLKNLPNFNLDGDRGYGWKTWRADDPANIESDNPVPVHYIDA
jgi:hypothetical protein